MGAYVLSIMVTVDQEYEIQKLFTLNNWPFIKIVSELSPTEHSTITTDTYTLIDQTDTVECTHAEQQAPSDGSGECMELLPVDLNMTLSVAENGHVISGNADTGHVTSGIADRGHVTPGITDTSHVTSGIAETGHVTSGIADTGHVTSGIADTGHVTPGNADTDHVTSGTAYTGEVNNGDGQMVADSMETISCSTETNTHDIATGQDMAPNQCRIRNGDNNALDCDETKESELGMSDRTPQVNTTWSNDYNIDTTGNDRTNEFNTGNKTSQVNTTVTETINCYADTTVNDENDSTDAGELDKVSNKATDSVVRTDTDDEETGAEDEVDTLLEELPSVRHITEVLKSKYPNSDLTINPASKSWSDSKYLKSARTDPASERWSDYMSNLNVEPDGYIPSLSVYFCKWCHYTFPGVKDLKRHERKGQCMFDCQFCKKKFSFKIFSKYQEHLKQHRLKSIDDAEVVHYRCPVCVKHISSLHRMLRHLELVHVFSRAFYVCSRCGVKCKSHSGLKAHKKTHELVCSHCGKVYSSVSTLNAHMTRVHSGIKHICNFPNCTYVGTSKQALDFHLNAHSGAKPYKCKHCDKSYQRKDSLSRHQLLCKTGASCKTCGKTFGSRNCLKDHVRAVHEGEKFVCMCGNKFKYASSLNRHQKKAGHTVEKDSGEVDMETL